MVISLKDWATQEIRKCELASQNPINVIAGAENRGRLRTLKELTDLLANQPMTVTEAGAKGGKVVAREYGPEFYQEIGKKGGEATAATHGREFYQEIGHKGGETVAQEYGPEFYSEIGKKGGEIGGKKGGEATAATHGREFYQEIGHKGGEAVSEKYGPEFYQEIGKRGGDTMSRLAQAGKEALSQNPDPKKKKP